MTSIVEHKEANIDLASPGIGSVITIPLDDQVPASKAVSSLPPLEVTNPNGEKASGQRRSFNPFWHPEGSPRHWNKDEAGDIGRFISGIMFYKFAFESLSTCIALFATTRFPKGVAVTLLSALTSVFALVQACSSIAVAQLLVRFPPNRLLAGAMWTFGALAAVIIFVELGTGGTFHSPGHWNPYIIFPIYICMGACLGILELIRRVIPADIVGASAPKLQRMDATVHIFYEVAGTAGAFASTPIIASLGYVYALVTLPFFFLASGLCYLTLKLPKISQGVQVVEDEDIAHQMRIAAEAEEQARREGRPTWQAFFIAAGREVSEFFVSIRVGARILFSSRKFSWLLLGYTLPLILHRIIENVIFPTFAKAVLHKGEYSGILLGSSNLGELCGALLVLCIGNMIPTPMPFVRWDGCALLILWAFSAWNVRDPLAFCLGMAPLLLCVSGGWAAGDVSLLAYIQSQLVIDWPQKSIDGVNPLSAVMGFLYSAYIVLYTVIALAIGRVLDYYIHSGDAQQGYMWVAGVFLTCCGALIVSSTFIPPGSFALNPKLHS